MSSLTCDVAELLLDLGLWEVLSAARSIKFSSFMYSKQRSTALHSLTSSAQSWMSELVTGSRPNSKLTVTRPENWPKPVAGRRRLTVLFQWDRADDLRLPRTSSRRKCNGYVQPWNWPSNSWQNVRQRYLTSWTLNSQKR